MNGIHNNDPSPFYYRIRVEGHLDLTWADWFDGLAVTQANGETELRGDLVDQAALFGLLKKIHNLGLTLILVERLQTTAVPPP